jgi:CubicO group peptidase (beta-lactamase class C family)
MFDDQIVAHATRRTFCRTSVQAALGLPLLSLAQAPATQWTELIADLEKRLPLLLSKAPTVPAVSMALVADGKLLWRGAYGVTDVTSKAPVDHGTVFEAGSVSKTVFAYMVLKLCEKKVLDLDTPLTRYTKDRFISGDDRLDQITTRHILSHTSGFQNWRSQSDHLKIGFTPGERWNYSGEGYSYLQSVVTHLIGHVNQKNCRTFEDGVKVCATDFDALMKTNLLVPFQMSSSGYLYRPGMARPHNEKGVMLANRKATPVDAARYGSAGGLHTTPTDYAKFLIEIVNPKPADSSRLSAKSLTEMVRPQVKIKESLSWGLGWAIEHKKTGGDLIGHSGDNPGFKALTAASISKKTGFVIFTNGDRGFEEIITSVVTSEPMQRFLSVTLEA